MGLKANCLRLFETVEEFNEERNNNYYEPWVSYTLSNSAVTYNKSEYEKLLETPLTFEITGDGNIVWKANNTAYKPTIEYKKNDGEWTSITSATGSSAPSISVVAGDVIQFRGDNATYTSGTSRYNNFSGTTCQFKVKGNIMSLLSKENFASADILQSAYNFYNLFKECNGLTDASKLILPATTLANYCYGNMFRDCTNLTTVPSVLPATTLANYCYSHMFEGCTSLTTAHPVIPATTLANFCYAGMFQRCTSLTTAPELPATTLTEGCYTSMFEDCRSLTTVPELPATTLANSCYESMFYGCSSLTTAPELPATTLTEGCYTSMFGDCGSLNYIKAMFTTTPGNSYTSGWVSDVASTGTFVKNSAATWNVSGINGIPTNWTVQDA